MVSQVGLSFLSFRIKSWVYNKGFKNWNQWELPPQNNVFSARVYDVLSHFPATSSAQKFYISMHVHTYTCTDMWWISLRIFPPVTAALVNRVFLHKINACFNSCFICLVWNPVLWLEITVRLLGLWFQACQ